jgi:hypothetical protein
MVGIFSLPGGTTDSILVHVTLTTPTVVAGNAASAIRVPTLSITALTGTPNLTVDVFDGSTAFLLRALAAMTANTSVLFNDGIYLRAGSFLRITASAAVDVVGTTSLPNTQTS